MAIFKSIALIVLSCVILHGIAAGADADQLLVSNGLFSGTPQVLSVNPSTFQLNGVFGDATGFDPSPGAMAKDSHGRVYILDANPDQIKRYDTAGKFLGNFAGSNFKVNGAFYGLAIDPNDNVYVSNDGPDASSVSDDSIVRFNANGVFLGAFGQATHAATGFDGNAPITIDQQGKVYTLIQGDVVRYGNDGSFLGVFGQATSAATFGAFGVTTMTIGPEGDLFARTFQRVYEFDTAGNLVRQYSAVGSGGVAVDLNRNVFTSDYGNGIIQEFNPSGNLVGTLSGPNLAGTSHLLFVPEPSTIVLAALAGFILAFRRFT